jgi:sec-independent protein translocase protein TatB
MFDIAWGEFVVIAVVALIVIGPKELPGVLRAIGQWTTKIRRMAAEFQGQFQEALREAEMADLKKEVDTLSDTAKGFTSQFEDPLNFKEATKWEPNSDPSNSDPAKPHDASKAADAPAEPAPVMPDGHPIASDAHSATEQIPATPAEAAPTPPAAPSSPERNGERAVHP